MSDIELAQTLPIDVLPLLESTSETTRMVYGKSSGEGSTGAEFVAPAESAAPVTSVAHFGG